MAGADRAINMALRMQGVGEAERDFRRIGGAGEKAFSQIERGANGAAREVSEYTARLKRAAASARADFANMQQLHKGSALQVDRNRSAFVLERVRGEQGRIRSGLPDLTLPGAVEGARNADLLTGALRGVGGGAGIAAIGLSAVAAGIALSVNVFQEHEQALDQFNATLSLSGNLSSATRQQIEKMAEGVSYATLQTEESVLKASTSLARVPGLTADAFEKALDASARFADTMKKDVSEVAEQTGTVLTAVAEKDLAALVRALDGEVDPAIARTIVQLVQAGKTAEAQQAYIAALADAAGDGPNGLALRVDRLTDKWRGWARAVGEFTVDKADAALGVLERGLGGIVVIADRATGGVLRLLGALGQAQSAGRPANSDPTDNSGLFGGRAGISRLLGSTPGQRDAAEWRKLRDSILDPDKPKKSRGRGGKSEAQREAERLRREAESARTAADRVRHSNEDVVESYRLRATEAEERLGLEGAALDAIERRQAIDATVRRLSADAIEKEVAARKAEAAVAGQSFNETAAREAATVALDKQTAALRDHATALYDADQAQKDFLAQQARAQALYEATRTPMERVNSEIAQLGSDLRAGIITADIFGRRIHQLAEQMVDDAARGRNAWSGFGADIATSLRDITLNGGKAKDILREIALMSLARVYDQNVGIPLANAIDGLTGNNRAKNVADAESALTARAVGRLGVNSDLAADAMGRIAGIGAPITGLGSEADATAKALGKTTASAGQLGTALGQMLSGIATGSRGGGGLFGTLLGAGLSLIGGGGSKIGITNGGAVLKAASKTSLKGFAGGGDPPIGMPFEVGENGREIMYLLPGGGARVIGNDRARSGGGFGGPSEINVNVSGARGNAEIMQMVRDGVQQGIANYDRVVGVRVQDYVARRG